MAVTDLQVAALRALLSGDFDESRRLIGQIGEDGMGQGYFPLVTSAFMRATKDRFSGQKRSDIVKWVADARAQRVPDAPLDPNVAERLILWVFDKATTDGIDFQTSYGHQTMLLASLIAERRPDDAELDEFLRGAREFADKMIERRDS